MTRRYKYDWEDPDIIGINKLRGRSISTCLNSKVSLNGHWKFRWQKDLTNFNEQDAIKGDTKSWDDIEIPSVWQLKGYGVPYYLAFDYPPGISKKKAAIPSIDHRENEVGIYSKEFEIPLDWKEKKIYIFFGAVKSAFHLFINGKKIGYSQGSMTPSEFEISNYLIDGINQVDVIVYRYSDGTYLEDQDMWFFSGIYREVYLHCQSKISIFDFFAYPSLDESYLNGCINLELDILNDTEVEVNLELEVILREGKTKTIEKKYTQSFVKLKGMSKVVFAFNVQNPNKWSAEYPNLYELELILKNSQGVLDTKKTRFGFRTVEIKNEKILVNGKSIIFKGVNRHDFDPDHGWAVPKERYYQDLYIMKQNNINAIRCSHYPNSKLFYELCDELGFYVMDEADLETHGVRRKDVPGDNPQWTKAVVDRMDRMVLTNRNHPCIVMWSLGNEAGYGSNFYKMKESALKLDSTRPFHYEGDYDMSVSDVLSRMYPTPQYLEKLGNYEEITVSFFQNIKNKLAEDNKPLKPEQYKGKPVVVCEYAHAMENSLGNFHKYMEVFEKYPNMAGGFIWDFVDQSIRVRDGEGEKWLYGGDFNDKKTHGYFCANGIVNADRKPNPSLYEVKKGYQNIKVTSLDPKTGRLIIHNKYSFTDLNEFRVSWVLNKDGISIKEAQLDHFDLKPGENKEVSLDFNGINFSEYNEYVLHISFILKEDKPWAKSGYEIAWEEFIIGKLNNGQIFKDNMDPKNRINNKINVEEKKDRLVITAAKSKFVINLNTAAIDCIDYGYGNILSHGIKVNYWRALTDNDKGLANFAPKLEKLLVDYSWKKATYGYKALVKEIKVEDNFVNVSFNIKHSNFKSNVVSFKIFDTGILQVDNDLISKKDMFRIGLHGKLVKDYSTFTWYGKGPHENYIDRNHGAKTHIYNLDILQMYHLYMRPQENGNRTEVRWLMVTNKDGVGFRVDDNSGEFLNFSAWPFSQVDLEEATHIHKLKFRDFITLNIDLKQRGVGGDLPGMAVLHEEYKIHKGKRHQLSFRIAPIRTDR